MKGLNLLLCGSTTIAPVTTRSKARQARAQSPVGTPQAEAPPSPLIPHISDNTANDHAEREVDKYIAPAITLESQKDDPQIGRAHV